MRIEYKSNLNKNDIQAVRYFNMQTLYCDE